MCIICSLWISHDSVLSTYIPRNYLSYSWEINLSAHLMSRSISGIFFGVNCKNWILSQFPESLFALIHLFKDLNSISVTFLKSSRLELINITLQSPAYETGLDLSLIDLIDLVCREEN